MIDIIINTFCISDKILTTKSMILYEKYNQKQKDVGITYHLFYKELVFQNLFVQLKLALIIRYKTLLNYVWLFNSEEADIKLPN